MPDRGGGARPPARRTTDVDVWMQGARELFALGDFSGSLEMIEQILRVDPSHHEARQYLQQNEATLIAALILFVLGFFRGRHSATSP